MAKADFTPSDLVFLAGLSVGRDRANLDMAARQRPAYVNHHAVHAALAVAFLAIEEAGILCLELVEKREFLGTALTLMVRRSPIGPSETITVYGLEAEIYQATDANPKQAYTVVRDWLATNHIIPCVLARERIIDSMVRRQLLERRLVKHRVLGLLTRTRLEPWLTDAAAGLLENGESAGKGDQLMRRTQNERAKLYDQLFDEIELGIDSREHWWSRGIG